MLCPLPLTLIIRLNFDLLELENTEQITAAGSNVENADWITKVGSDVQERPFNV